MMSTDLSAILPEGNAFTFWETACEYTRFLHVDANHSAANDEKRA